MVYAVRSEKIHIHFCLVVGVWGGGFVYLVVVVCLFVVCFFVLFSINGKM